MREASDGGPLVFISQERTSHEITGCGKPVIKEELMMRMNGNECDADGKTIRECLKQAGYEEARVAVERNGVIVPKTAYGDTVLADGDEVEVVSFVGGG